MNSFGKLLQKYFFERHLYFILPLSHLSSFRKILYELKWLSGRIIIEAYSKALPHKPPPIHTHLPLYKGLK